MSTTAGIIGHRAAIGRLAAAVAAPNHAYLLSGPPHVGKRTLARAFAATLLCGQPGADLHACDRCAQCLLRRSGNHPDYLELPRDGKLGIDQVRELKRALGLSRHSAARRVAVIPEAERLAGPAQNALLKLLEEPPAHTVLILTARAPETLLATTVSRCQHLALGVPSETELEERLNNPHAAGEADSEDGEDGARRVKAAIAAAANRPGLAITLLENPERLDERQAWASLLLELADAPVSSRLAAAKQLADNPDLPDVLEWWMQLHRQALHAELENKNAPQDTAEESALPPHVLQLARRFTESQLTANLRTLVAARSRLGYNPNVLLLVESTLLSLGET